jgi:hypothetical protein
MFSHEGGHGIIVVPAIILNQEIPKIPIEGMQENPFRNFPLGIFSLFLAFPLEIAANGFLLYLSLQNAKQYRNSKTMKELFLLSIFLSFCILNFSGILTNFFGQDFAFIIKDILKVPADEQWFRSIMRILVYIVFPLFLTRKYQFKIDKMLIISGTTYLGYYTILVDIILPPLAPIFMTNFWWLFIIGLIILIGTMTLLIRNIEPVAKRVEKRQKNMLTKTTAL